MANESHAATFSTLEDADSRFLPVVQALIELDGFSLMESKSDATRGLMHNGKSFDMSSHGHCILKLTPERAAALIEHTTGQPFWPSPGRIMKDWVEITDPRPDWVDLAQGAYELATDSTRKPNG
jgi:hypothetical protein